MDKVIKIGKMLILFVEIMVEVIKKFLWLFFFPGIQIGFLIFLFWSETSAPPKIVFFHPFDRTDTYTTKQKSIDLRSKVFANYGLRSGNHIGFVRVFCNDKTIKNSEWEQSDLITWVTTDMSVSLIEGINKIVVEAAEIDSGKYSKKEVIVIKKDSDNIEFPKGVFSKSEVNNIKSGSVIWNMVRQFGFIVGIVAGICTIITFIFWWKKRSKDTAKEIH